MQDDPKPTELLAAVAGFLRDVVAAGTEPRTSFLARVSANALDLVGRQITLQAGEEEQERIRLMAILDKAGTLDELNEDLSRQLAEGGVTLGSEGLAEHLWLTTLAKLAVDQPAYASYRAVLATRDHSAKEI